MCNKENNMEQPTIEVVKKYFNKKGNWTKTNYENAIRFYNLFIELNRIYELKTNLIIDFGNPQSFFTGGGMYVHRTNTIHLFRPSLMTALHEWRHRLQYSNYCKNVKDKEKNAVLWSHRIFEQALPNTYKKANSENKFFHNMAN